MFDHAIRMVHMVEEDFPKEAILISVSEGMGVSRRYKHVIMVFNSCNHGYCNIFVTYIGIIFR